MSGARSVVAAAIRSHATGEVFSLPPPARHHTILQRMGPFFSHDDDEQGFLLSDGAFARRKTAYVVACDAEQIAEGAGTAPQHGLFSEDLW